MARTVVVGIDAACWSRMRSLLAQDKLPNLAAVAEGGVSARLGSTSPPMTPPAWTSMVTGVGPERHGVQDFLEMDTETHRIAPVGATDLNVPAIWDVFGAEGRRIGMLNLPIIYPPPTVDGCFLSGIPHDVEDGIAHPDWLQTVVEDLDYTVHPRQPPDDPEAYLEDLDRLVAARTEVALAVLEETDVELLWTVYMAVDWVQHYFWGQDVDDEDAVDSMYRLVDEQIGVLRDTVGDDWNVAVVSDHGATPVEHELHLNTLLEEWGFVARHESAGVKRGVQRVLDRALVLGTRLPEPVKSRLRRVLTSNRHARLRELAGRGQLGMGDAIDWTQTRAFSYGYMGQIHVNRDDWYARGTVSAADYEEVREDLVERFEVLTHPATGEKLLAAARTADELYGEIGPDVPDVVLEPVDWNAMIYGDFAEDWVRPAMDRVADHAPEGIFVASGPAFAEGDRDVVIDAVDIAPTLLHLHGLPVPASAEGAILMELFDEAFKVGREVRRETMTVEAGSRTAEGQSDAIEDRLEDLGYL